jgi:hypothetical protein
MKNKKFAPVCPYANIVALKPSKAAIIKMNINKNESGLIIQ